MLRGLDIEQEFDGGVRDSFIYTGSVPVAPESVSRRVPERIYVSPKGERATKSILSTIRSLNWRTAKGTSRKLRTALSLPIYRRDRLSPKPKRGAPSSSPVHSQTLSALNTGRGIRVMREAIRRLRARYGPRLTWHTARELAAAIGV